MQFGVRRGFFKKNLFKIFGYLFLLSAFIFSANSVRIVLKSTEDESQSKVLGASTSEPSASSSHIVQVKVQTGDTLFTISQKYNIPWTTVATLNSLKSPFTLKAGQILKIPQD
jgi:LysM repeat protein